MLDAKQRGSDWAFTRYKQHTHWSFVRLTDTTASLFRFASETNLERDVAAVMSSSLWCKMSILAAALQIAALLKRVVSE